MKSGIGDRGSGIEDRRSGINGVLEPLVALVPLAPLEPLELLENFSTISLYSSRLLCARVLFACVALRALSAFAWQLLCEP